MPHRSPLTCLIAAVLICIGCGTVPAFAAEGFEQELDAAVKQLRAESENLDKPEPDPKAKPTVNRPHTLVRGWSPDRAEAVLQAITAKYSGNDERDAYIRYHLLYVVEQHMIDALAPCFVQGEAFDPSKFSPDPGVIRRLDSLPATIPSPAVQAKWRDENTYEPAEIHREHERLRQSTMVEVGVPPFTERFYGSDALPHLSGARKQQVEQTVAKMTELRKQFTVTRDQEAVQYNKLVSNINRVLREYRARVVLVLLQSSEEKFLRDVLQATESMVNAESKAAFDLLDAMYMATFDGYMALYDEQTLSRFGRDLERLGASHEQWVWYERIDGGPTRRALDVRNFAEAVFTLSQLMQAYHKIEWMARTADRDKSFGEVEEVISSPPARPKSAFLAERISGRDVFDAIARATKALNQPAGETDSERFLPYIEPESRQEKRGEVPDRVTDPLDDGRWGTDEQWEVNRAGNQALAAWAQLETGGHYLSPQLYRRIYWSLARDSRYSFDRSMRLQMLSNLPSDEFKPWVRRDAMGLYASLSDKGNFLELTPPITHNERGAGRNEAYAWGDHANGSYGVLGLWAANRAGAEPNLQAIGLIDKHWRATQDKSSGGWAVLPLNVAGVDTKLVGGTTPTAEMTAAGLATLTLTERYLRGDDMANLGSEGRSEELLRALAWLDKNFSLPADVTYDESSGGGGKKARQLIDFYYYMWTMQRVSRATGYQSFNNINLSRTVTAEILNRQNPDGTWSDKTGRSSDLVSTCFAMLYLADALQPAGVAKLRYGGAWDNRPNDIWNFSDYVSDVFESPVTWQIVTPNEPLPALVASPILYASTDDDLNLNDKELKNLRAYVEAGGMLMLNADGNKPKARTSLDRLAEALFPDYQVQDLASSDHPINNILYEVSLPTRVVTNGVRPLVLLPGRDLSEALQKNETGEDAFKYMTNAYLYAVGRVTRQSRLDDSYMEVDASAAKSLPSVKTVRLDVGPGSNPEPEALPQMRAFMVREHLVDLDLSTVKPEALSADIRLAFLAVTEGVTVNEAQGRKLMDWVQGGGTLVVDAAGGSAEAGRAMGEVLATISGGQDGHVVASFDPIINGEGLGETAHDNSRVTYNRYTTFTRRAGNSPLIRAIDVGGRPGIIFSNEDLSATLAGVDHWGLQGYTVETARRLIANVVLAARK